MFLGPVSSQTWDLEEVSSTTHVFAPVQQALSPIKKKGVDYLFNIRAVIVSMAYLGHTSRYCSL